MRLHPSVFILIAVFCLSGIIIGPLAAADELATRLESVPSTHPRLFFNDAQDASVKAKLEGNPHLKATLAYLIDRAEALKNVEPVKRKKVGRRLLGVSRTCLQRVSYLAFAYRMTGDKTHLRRAEAEMLAAAAFEDWNPSHFLDVAEMTAALAIGYDWLYNDLDPAARDKIRAAIVEKGLRTSMKGGGWVRTNNNWNQVCHAGLTLGALAVLEDEPELARKIIARAVENVPRAMHEYVPDGVYPEGPGYWGYGTTFNVLLISALESVLRSDFGLLKAEGFMETPDFYLRATGPTGLYYNFSDCGASGGASSAMHWFAARTKNPSLLWHEKDKLAEFAAGKGAASRVLPFLLIWAQPPANRPIADATPPKRLHWKGDGRTPVALLRSGWDKGATFVGFKGGSPGTNHGHMDIGSFVVDMQGVRWAAELGAQGYHGLESKGVDLWNRGQDSQRWTVFRLNNFGHSTLVVDDQLQRVKGKAPITAYSGDPEAGYAIVDMASVYEGQLAQARRGIRMLGKSVLIQDEVKSLDREASVRWGMITRAQVEVNSDHQATLTQSGKTLKLHLLAPESASLTVWDIEKPPRDYDAKNPNTRMVGFTIAVPPDTESRFGVLLEGSDGAGKDSVLKPLSEW